jgi:predicted DCC family thiol-disulfide oxidoreductase YuxK
MSPSASDRQSLAQAAPIAGALAPDGAPDGLMVFDGVCNFCSGAVRLVTLMDPDGLIRFSAIQSPYGQALCRQAGVDPEDPTTFLFFDRGRPLMATDAMAALAGRLRRPWRWLRGLAIVPRPLRDSLYRLVATHRYRLFGKRAACRIPSAALRARFIDEPPSAA